MSGFDPLPLGRRAEAMLAELAAISEDENRLTRHYLTPQHRRAIDLVRGWMERVGLMVELDNTATVSGFLPAAAEGPSATRRLAVGSHIDTVVDGGRYDGTLGVVAGILAVEELRARGEALPFALEVLAFGDEEGCRFPKTLIGSSAVAGVLDPEVLENADADGVTLRQALTGFGLDVGGIGSAARDPETMLGYLEVHIEQGPVLESSRLALGVVTSIAGQTRLAIRIAGEAGHAGTVPMALRHDALAAAAEFIGEIEAAARRGSDRGLVATVGQISVSPGAVNVIPGEAHFTLDLRCSDDDLRNTTIYTIRRIARELGGRRGVVVGVETVHETPGVSAADWLQAAIGKAIQGLTGDAAPRLMSGAGHDGQAMARLTDIGMIFVRCRAGISHSPLEYVSVEDLGLAVEALIRTIAGIAETVRTG